MASPVAQWAGLAQKYGHKYKIPTNVLLGLIDVETGGTGNPHLTSPAGAQGLGQFMPGTARQYKVKPWDPASSIRGAAQYLTDLGFHRDPKRALASYNGGPGNPQFGYANEVLKRAGNYNTASIGGTKAPALGHALSTPVSAIDAPQNVGSALAAAVQPRLGGVTPPQAPSFAASVPTPKAYQPPPGVADSAPQPDVRAQLQQALNLNTPAPYQPTSASPLAQSPADASPGAGGLPKTNSSYKIRDIFSRAAAIDAEHLPYKWGGGHGPTPAKPGVPLDCSGAVSRLFGVAPRVSGQYETFGKPGRGKQVTIYANGTHVLVEIAGRFWGTSGTNPGGGAGWIPRSAISQQYLKNFTARHPAGL